MRCCSARCKKGIAFSVGGVFLLLGLLAVFLWMDLYQYILSNELTIKDNSVAYKMWKDTPIPIYLSIYLYNWTNSEAVLKDWSLKPDIQELGPYVFLEKHERVDIKWNKNGTMVKYNQIRRWNFEPDRSNGSLEDEVTSLNVIAAAVAYMVRDRNYFIKKAVDLFLNEKEKTLTLTRTSGEWIFDGFKDELLELAQKLNMSLGGMDKFGWFYNRNNSKTYDGSYTMYTGTDDIEMLGMLELWNDKPRSPYYSSYCGYVNGTSGELWPPMTKFDKAQVFSSDICSTATIFHVNKTPTLEGIVGKEYEGTDFLFDNGTKYPEQACFNGDEVFPSGVRDVSKCKFNAPAYVSYPHFYLADPIYREKITGMNPDPKKHQFKMALQADTGLPLYVDARLQINLRLTPIEHIKMFENVAEVMIPVLWFHQAATLTPDLASMIKVMLVIPDVGVYTGYGFIGVGVLIILIALFVTYKGAWTDRDQEQLLPERAL